MESSLPTTFFPGAMLNFGGVTPGFIHTFCWWIFSSHQFGSFRGELSRLKASIYVEKSSTLRLQRWQISVEHPCAYDWRHLGGQMVWETWVKDSSDFGEEYGIYFVQLDLKWEIPGLRERFCVKLIVLKGMTSYTVSKVPSKTFEAINA